MTTTHQWHFQVPRSSRPVEPGPVPSFSVVIAAYNVADLIGEAVSSALAQTVTAHEVIVCDDGSTDDIMGALAPYLDRITLLRQENLGEAAAKNAAVDAATGDFVVILDGDDVDDPRRLEGLGALASSRPDLDILSTDCYLVEGDTILRRYHEPFHPYEVDDQRTAILQRNFVFNPAVRRERWLAVGGFDRNIRFAADWDCWIRLILDGSAAGLVDEPLVRYRQRPGRLTNDRVAMFEGRVQVLSKSFRDPALRPSDQAVLRSSLSAAKLRLAEEALHLRHPRARAAARGVATDPSFALLTRAKGLLASLVPGLAARAVWKRR